MARKIGKVYFDMGFLASDEVVDCSASDLVAQYVGQTGPLVRAMFDKALGKVSSALAMLRSTLFKILNTVVSVH